MRNLRELKEFTPMEVVTPESYTRVVPHPTECWGWWVERGFLVHERNLGSFEWYFLMALPWDFEKEDEIWRSIDYYRFQDGWEEILTSFIYKRGIGYKEAWRMLTRLHSDKKDTN